MSKKIFVLDTSVVLHDHQAVEKFEDNDIAIPITVLEELDNFKKGGDTKNFEARQFIRWLDKALPDGPSDKWVKIPTKEKGRLRVIMADEPEGVDATRVFRDNKADHRILNTALMLKEQVRSKKVILITKDINLRLKAKALGLHAEDYLNDMVGKSPDDCSITTIADVESGLIDSLFKSGSVNMTNGISDQMETNHFYILQNGKTAALTQFTEDRDLRRVEKQYVMGIRPKNAEQTFALDAIMNPDIKLAAIQGVAGTGKTLLALAGALEQRRKFHQIVLARPIIPLSNRDIGYLPGSANDKIDPYMQPLWDNLEFIKNQYGKSEKKRKIIEDMLELEKIVITPLAFIRGRSLSHKFFIIDEAQNLTPLEVKTIITRAGEGTKIVFTGDVKQIDTPYLDERSNGLSYLVEKLSGNKLFAHVKLEKGERSELASLANDLL